MPFAPGCAYILGMHSGRLFPLALAAGLFAGCAPTSPKPSVSTVAVTPDVSTISVGQSVRIVATVSTNPGGSAYAVTWTTSEAAAAVVDSMGLVLGVATSPGVSICATATTGSGSSDVKGCATVVVQPNPVCPGPSGTLIPSVDTLHVGDVAQFAIPASQLSGRSAGEIRWTVDQPAVASIDSSTGAVTARSVGGTDVIATDRILTSPCPHDWRAIVIVR